MIELDHKRQTATSVDGIREDHVSRYRWAIKKMNAHKQFDEVCVLDVGCGVGYGAYIMANEGDCAVTGIDINEQAISHAQEYFRHDQVNYMTCDIRNEIPLTQRPHFVTMFEVIEHLHEPIPILKKLAGSSAKYLFGSVPNEEVIPFDEEKHPWHARHYTLDDVHILLGSTGWRGVWYGGQKGKRKPHDEVQASQFIKRPWTLVFMARKME